MLRPRAIAIAITVAALASVLLALDAGAALPRKDAGYQGSTSLGRLTNPVALRVSKSGASVTRLDIQWRSTCTPAGGRGSLGGLAVIKSRPISPKGRFASTASYSRDFGGGLTARYTVAMTGTFSKRVLARGTLRVTVAIASADGQQVDSCNSGAVTWQARD